MQACVTLPACLLFLIKRIWLIRLYKLGFAFEKQMYKQVRSGNTAASHQLLLAVQLEVPLLFLHPPASKETESTKRKLMRARVFVLYVSNPNDGISRAHSHFPSHL
jgi:hypothetical protein